ncbi:trypsin-like serine protease [Siculibacillus lacustris]|uniref:Trypsin-like serine protease n=1 Tax=Siculibacillus lacustris TaxID=1549641 RepID=A0A4Q9VM01_9HYPH|nr:trypsin-like serine protease [Siculibacillus lacustris]TBW36588.1 trypsin-like serine protease [Siculibacillus lacustris]
MRPATSLPSRLLARAGAGLLAFVLVAGSAEAAEAVRKTPAKPAAPTAAAVMPTPLADADPGLTRVVGGRKAADGAWPSQVEIYAPDPAGRGRFRTHCGGTVIASTWVLTAAHCFVAGAGPGARRQSIFARDILVVAGRSHLATVMSKDDDLARRAVRAKNVIYHPDFQPGDFANDVALVELERPAGAPAIALLGEADRQNDLSGLAATVVGWGFVKETANFDLELLPSDLQEVELPVVDVDRCRGAYVDSQLKGNSIDERNICAGFAAGGRDACRGDSGGPLMVRDLSGAWAQAGVVSWGEGCGRKSRFGVYTRVAYFEPWIRMITGDAIAAAARPSTEHRLSADTAPVAVASLPDAGVAGAPSAPLFELVTPSSVARSASLVERGDRALVIGIDGYIDPLSLTGSVADAEAVSAMLVDTLGFRRDQIMTLTNEKATRANILAALDAWIVQGSTPGARVFLYYSGQGFQSRVFPSLRDGLPGPVIVPIDLALQRDDEGRVRDVGGAITTADLRRVVARLADRSVTAVFDATPVSRREFQRPTRAKPEDVGGVRAVEAVLDLPPDLAEIQLSEGAAGGIDPSGRAVVWTGSGFDQWALVDRTGAEPMGVFTRLWVDGLRAGRLVAGRQAEVTLSEFAATIRAAALARCDELGALCRLGLTPQLTASEAALGAAVSAARARGAEARDVPKAANPAEVKLEADFAAPRAAGTRPPIQVSTRKPGWLLLIEIGKDGQMRQIWPDVDALRRSTKPVRDVNLIQPGRTVTLTGLREPSPGAAAGGALGLVALLSDKPLQAIDLPEQPGNAADLAGGLLFLDRHVRGLQALDPGSAQLAEIGWSFDAVLPRNGQAAAK